MGRCKCCLFLIFGITTIISTIFLSSCESEPFLSMTETVEVFNSSRDFVKTIDDNYGYETKFEYHYASTYYIYVLYDGYAFCPEVKSYSPTFKTESDSYDGPIKKNDICIECGYKWSEHRHAN